MVAEVTVLGALKFAAASAAVSVASTAVGNLIRGPLEAPKLDQTLRDDQGEGAPLQRCYGQQAVCRPRVLWYRPFSDTDTEGNIFGGEREETDYYCDVALALCEGPQYELVRLYAGGRLIWTNETLITDTSNQIGMTRFEILDNDGDLRHVQLRLDSPATGPDLTRYKAGEKIRIQGSDVSENNSNDWKVARRSFDSSGNTFLFLKNTFLKFLGQDDPAGSDVTLTQNLKRFNKRKLKLLEFFPGDSLQEPWDVIERYEGEDEVPAYQGICYLGITKLKLNDFGGSLPEFRAVVSSSEDPVPLADIVTDVVTNTEGLDASNVDVSGVTGIVDGATFNPTAGKEMLEPFAISHNLMAQERGGVLHFFTRDQAQPVAIDPADLGCHRLADPGVRNFEVFDRSEVEIPSKVSVRYFDPQRDYAQGAHEEPQLNIDGDDERVIDLPITFTSPVARGIAARVRWLLESNRQRVRGPLPQKYAHLQENDIAQWRDPDTDKDWSVLIDRVDKRWDGITVFEGIQEEQSATQFDRTADPVGRDPDDVYIPPDLQTVVADISPRSPAQARVPGIYWTAAREDADNDWIDATLYRSPDDVTYTPVALSGNEGTVGFCTTRLGNAQFGFWDETNTLDVQVVGRELSSATRSEIETGLRNLALVGNELICFRDIFVPAGAQPGAYTLSGFLRGVGNTGHWIPLHSATERFVMLDGAAFNFLEVPSALLGSDQFWKALAAGGEIDDSIAEEVTIGGVNVKPWSPSFVTWSRNEASPFTQGYVVRWVRRTREPGPMFGPKPLVEPFERYRIRILDDFTSSGGQEVAQYFVTNISQFNYSDNQRTNDGQGLPFYVAISQWGDTLQDYGCEIEAEIG